MVNYLSGKQYEISHTDSKGRVHTARITSLSAALREYTVDGLDVVTPFEADQLPPYYSGITLFPFPNRLEDGTYSFEGVEYQLPINELDKHNQLHSFSQYYDFATELEVSKSEVSLRLAMPALTSYPFLTHFDVTYSLDDTGLSVAMEATNVGKTNAPCGFGGHPWFSCRGNMDDASLQFSAESWVKANERLIPVEETAIPERFDFSEGRTLKGADFDDAFVKPTKLDESAPGVHQVLLTGADGHKTLVWSDGNYPDWQICSGNGIPGDLNRFGLAIEPMTCYANAFKTGRNLIVLKPGQSAGGTWGVVFE
ncbi:MAG: aldose 1-epimerase family protein [Candidatus Ancillula sp.]|nr:aldose 1-epimerase family protein [Candidatus Ancillula sp.]